MAERIMQSNAFESSACHATAQIAEVLHDEVIQRLFAVGVGLNTLAFSPDCSQFRDQILVYAAQLDDALQAAYRIAAL